MNLIHHRASKSENQEISDRRKLPSAQCANNHSQNHPCQTVTYLPKKPWLQRQPRIAMQNEIQQGLLTQEKLQQQFFSHKNRVVMLPQSMPFYRKQNQQSRHVAPFSSLGEGANLQHVPTLPYQVVKSLEEQVYKNRKINLEQGLQVPENNHEDGSKQEFEVSQVEQFAKDCLENDVYHNTLAASDERFQKSVDLLEAGYKKAKTCLQEEIDQIVQTDARLGNFEYSLKFARPSIKDLEAKRQRLIDQEKNERTFLEVTHNQEIATLITKLEQCKENMSQTNQVTVDQGQLDDWGQRAQDQTQQNLDHHINMGDIIEQEYLSSLFGNKQSADILPSDILSKEKCLPGSRLDLQDTQEDFPVPYKAENLNKAADECVFDMQMKGNNAEHDKHSLDIQKETQKTIAEQANYSVSSFNVQTKDMDQGVNLSTHLSDPIPSYDSGFISFENCGSDFAIQTSNFDNEPNKIIYIEQPETQEMPQHNNNGPMQDSNSSFSPKTLNNSSSNPLSKNMTINENGDEEKNLLYSLHPCPQASILEGITPHSYSPSTIDTSRSSRSDAQYPGLKRKGRWKSLSKPLPSCRVDKRRSSDTNLNRQKQKMPREIIAPLKKNRFGGIKGSPIARYGIDVHNYDSSLDPLCHASFYEDDYSDVKPQLVKSTQYQNSLNSNIGVTGENVLNIQHSGFETDSTRNHVSSPECSTIEPELDTTINLHNPEFYQKFDMPLDAQIWIGGKCGARNLTLHGKAPKGRVTVNMISPKFHSGVRIDGVSIHAEPSQELMNYLAEEGCLPNGTNNVKSFQRVEPEQYCGSKVKNLDTSQGVAGQLPIFANFQDSGDQGKLNLDSLSKNLEISS